MAATKTGENPVDLLIRRFGMTRLDMTRKYGFGANHLLLVAQGRKDSLGMNLLGALDEEAALHGLSIPDIMTEEYGFPSPESAWKAWCRDQRRLNKSLIPDLPVEPKHMSPWARIVSEIGSVAKTAQILRVRDLVVSRYLTKPNMPSALRTALRDCNYPTEALESAQQEFFLS